MVCNELNSHIPLQQGIIFFIPLESTCRLFVAYYHEFLNRESYDAFAPKISYLTYLSRNGASRICLIYEVVRCHKD